eukprot:m.27210 g.27210  ORF g.27210 m.27210 type:complete len:160 (-) comp11754_c0_seq28:721-1200(-)
MVLVALLEYSMLCMLVMFHHVARALTFSCDVQPQKAGDGPPSAKKAKPAPKPKAKRPAAQATRRAGSKKKEGAVLHANEVDVVGMANINEQLEDDLLMAKFMPQAQRGGIQDEYTVAKPGLDRLVQRVTAHTLGHGILTSAETYAVLSHATEVGTTDKG